MTIAPNKHGDLFDVLLPHLKAGPHDPGLVVAIVGGGGKTATLFALATASRARGLRVAVTTTTHIRDPRLELGRDFDHIVLVDESGSRALQHIRTPGITVVAATVLESEGRLSGIEAPQIEDLRRQFDLVLVEADGSRGLPVKAPAAHEPVLPLHTSLLIGVIGLDCLGKPMDAATVHRPEMFGPLSGCAPGEIILAGHLVSLCQANEGLFKGCPPQTARILLLNKADLLVPMDDRAAAGNNAAGNKAVGRDAESHSARLYRDLEALHGGLDGYLVCSLEPRFRIMHAWFQTRTDVVKPE